MNTTKTIRRALFSLSYMMLASSIGSVWASDRSESDDTLAFGSCLRQWKPQPVWQNITNLSPSTFVFLGDNVYSDAGKYTNLPEPERIGRAYEELSVSSEFQTFRTAANDRGTEIYGTWDDHDYGRNDGGNDYPFKLESKKYFLDFFEQHSTDSGAADQPGVYQNRRIHLAGLDAQLILLDTRSFRSPLKKDATKQACPPTHIVANRDPGATILGEQQWQWLKRQLLEPADLRIIASSIQVIPQQHCFEKWANFPEERQKLFDLIATTKAEGVLLISGDRHFAEISKLPADVIGYPLYEVTASGLNSAMGPKGLLFAEKNQYRIGESEFSDNFGTLQVHTTATGTKLVLNIHESSGVLSRSVSIDLKKLKFNPSLPPEP